MALLVPLVDARRQLLALLFDLGRQAAGLFLGRLVRPPLRLLDLAGEGAAGLGGALLQGVHLFADELGGGGVGRLLGDCGGRLLDDRTVLGDGLVHALADVGLQSARRS